MVHALKAMVFFLDLGQSSKSRMYIKSSPDPSLLSSSPSPPTSAKANVVHVVIIVTYYFIQHSLFLQPLLRTVGESCSDWMSVGVGGGV